MIINGKLITNLDDENLLVTIYGFQGAQTTTYRRRSPLRSSPILGPPIWASTSVFCIECRVSIHSTTEQLNMKNLTL